MLQNNAKIVFLDIETAPTLAWIWKRFKENISHDQVERESSVFCIVAKFLNEKKVRKCSIPDFKNWQHCIENDENVIKFAWNILNEADIIVAHNGKSFDIPVLNSRFIQLGLPPPKPYKIIDTLEIAKKKFRFGSNKLDSICDYFGLGRKIKTDFSLWTRCLKGELKAWKEMIAYCIHDTLLLEQVYLKMLPYIDNHPNTALFGNMKRPCCPKCGSDKIIWRGYYIGNTQVYKRFQCKSCGGYGRERTSSLTKEQKAVVMTNAVTS